MFVLREVWLYYETKVDTCKHYQFVVKHTPASVSTVSSVTLLQLH